MGCLILLLFFLVVQSERPDKESTFDGKVKIEYFSTKKCRELVWSITRTEKYQKMLKKTSKAAHNELREKTKRTLLIY